MLRFSSQTPTSKPNRAGRTPARQTLAGRLRLPLMFAALLLILAARARLKQPETHQAIGNMLEGVTANTTTAGTTAEATPPTTTASSSTPAAWPSPALSKKELASIEDNAPFRTVEEAAWFALLADLKSTPHEQIASSSNATVGYAALVSAPDSYRARLISVVGLARRVEYVTPAANTLGIDKLYRLTIEPDGGDVWPISIYTLEAPLFASNLSKENPVTEIARTQSPRISVTGYFFKNQSYRWADGVGITPVIVAKRINQSATTPTAQPDRTVAQPNKTEPLPSQTDFVLNETTNSEASLGRALLSDLGVDLTAFDGAIDKRSLSSKENQPFYATLEAVKKTPARQLARLAEGGLAQYAARHGLSTDANKTARPVNQQQVMQALVTKEAKRQRYSTAILFGNTSSQRGELLAYDGIVRRVVRIEAPNESIGHYYELELFPEDSQNLPLVFCVAELPDGFPIGEAIRQPARLVGFFFKQWAYRSRHRGNEPGADARRFAPLLIGRAPIALASPGPEAYRPGGMLGILGTSLLLATILGMWAFHRADRSYERRVMPKLNSSGKRDFSQLP